MRKVNGINYEEIIEALRFQTKTEISDPNFPITVSGHVSGIVLGNATWHKGYIIVYFPSVSYYEQYFDQIEEEIGRLNRMPEVTLKEETFASLGHPESTGKYCKAYLPKIISEIIVKALDINPKFIKAKHKQVPQCFIENPTATYTKNALRLLNDFRGTFLPKRSKTNIYSPTHEFAVDIANILESLGYTAEIRKEKARNGRSRTIWLYGKNSRKYMTQIGHSKFFH